jgi:hypothetical protein
MECDYEPEKATAAIESGVHYAWSKGTIIKKCMKLGISLLTRKKGS